MKLNCQECNAEMKKERGCTKKGLVPFVIDGETHFRCPVKLVDSSAWEYLNAYTLYKLGMLPSGKGWLCESRKFLTAMTVIGGEIANIQKAEMDKAKSKQRKR